MQGAEIYIFGFAFSVLWLIFAESYRSKYRKFGREKDNKYGHWFLLFSCLSIYLIMAFRYNVGIDNDNYLNNFQSIRSIKDIAEYYEPGFGLLTYLCNVLFGDYQVFIFITSIITGILFFKTLYRDADFLVLALLGFVSVNLYFMSFTVIRQFLAIAVVLMSIPYIEKQKPWQFLAIWAIAISLHYSAALFGLVYFFSMESKWLTNKVKIIILATLAVLTITYTELIIGEVLQTAALLRETYADLEYTGDTNNLNMLLSVIPGLLVIIFFHKSLIKANPTNKVYIWMYLIFVLTKILGHYVPFMSRTHFYFDIAFVVLMSYLPRLTPKATRPIVYLVLVLYFAHFINNIFVYQPDDFLPYHSIFNKH